MFCYLNGTLLSPDLPAASEFHLKYTRERTSERKSQLTRELVHGYFLLTFSQAKGKEKQLHASMERRTFARAEFSDCRLSCFLLIWALKCPLRQIEHCQTVGEVVNCFGVCSGSSLLLVPFLFFLFVFGDYFSHRGWTTLWHLGQELMSVYSCVFKA